jgi:DNA-binding LacI/PurR family transcriptional regulator
VAVTIKDIAEAAGVIPATVSRALNDSPMVKEATRQRILKLAKEMGYVTRAEARLRKVSGSNVIGMVLTTIADPFLPGVVAGAEQAAYESGYGLFLTTSHGNPDRELQVIEALCKRHVDALVIASMWGTRVHLADLARLKVPIVFVNHPVDDSRFRYVSVDDVLAARIATEHLVRLGHRRVAFVKSAGRPPGYVERRLEGYRQVLTEAGLELEKQLEILPEGQSDFHRGQASLGMLLQAKASAVVCYNDLTAFGLLKSCHRMGLRVPEMLSVVGIDGVDATEHMTPALTTVSQPRAQLGYKAVKKAISLMRVLRQDWRGIHNKLVEPTLMIRESTRHAIS